MSIAVRCSSCQQKLSAPQSLAGKSVKCPKCQGRIDVPEASESDSKEAVARFPIKCHNCSVTLRVPETIAGKAAKCPKCGVSVEIPHNLRSKTAKPRDAVGDDILGALGLDAPVVAADSKRDSEGEQIATSGSSGATSSSHSADESKSHRKSSSGASRTASAGTTGTFAAAIESRPNFDLHDRLCWVWVLFFIPLAFSVFTSSGDVESRLDETIEANTEVFDDLLEEDIFVPEDDAGLSLEGLVSMFPGRKIIGAHLAVDSWIHWLYAGLSAIGFLGIVMLLFRTDRATPFEMLWRGVLVGTLGVFLLLGFQFVAALTEGMVVRGGGLATLIFYLVKFVGFSYRAALDPNNGFLLSFIGFTFGVGLCEELCKSSLLLIHFRTSNDPADWRSACAWGLACGVGFGVSEGISYSSSFYNGFQGLDAYVVRFVSCVALHAVWSGTVAILMARNKEGLQGEWDWGEFAVLLIWYLGVAMVLHGLYDTFLKRDMPVWALVTAFGSFLWFAFLIERSRHDQMDAHVRGRTSVAS